VTYVPRSPTVNWRRVATFVGVTFAINWGAVGVMWLAGMPFSGPAGTAFAAGYMLVPAAVAILLARRWAVPLRDWGVRLPRNWHLAFAPALPILLAVLTIATAVLMGFGEFDPTGMAMIERWEGMGQQELADSMRDRADEMPINLVLVTLLAAPIAGFTINGLFAFGEELGWRGLLQQELAPLGFARGSALIGVIWGLWHAPLILLGHNFPAQPRLGVLVMTVACVPLGIVMSWIALKAQTVIAAAVAHGTYNAASGVTLMALSGGDTIEVFILGYAGIVATALVAAVLLAFRPREPRYLPATH
jgi:membrane protease YdiL (CAAX protease family)